MEGVAEVAKVDEVGASGFRVFVEGGDAHEALDLKAIEAEEIVELRQKRVWRKAVFAGFGGDVDFKIDFGPKIEFGRDALDVAGEVKGVEALNSFDVRQNFADFVALQGTDEVPAEVGWKGRRLGEDFLDAVFAKQGLASFDSFLNGLDREGFGDGHEFDAGGITRGAGSCGVETLADGGEAFEEGDHGGKG